MVPAANSDAPRRALPSLLLLALLVGLAYANSLRVPFVFDDVGSIGANRSLETFATALQPPADSSVAGRPLVNLSLAVNHALSGQAVWSYHVGNVLLHVASASLVFLLVRWTLRRRPPTAKPAVAEDGFALAVAALWAVHPLQTASVTYLMQRSELLVSFCALLTLACFVRGVAEIESAPAGTSAASTRFPPWLAASVVAAAAGMASKEIMAVVPLLVFGYDATFVAGSFAAAWTRRRGYYVALAASELVLVALLLVTDGRGESAGFHRGVSVADYAFFQFEAIARYVQLTLWPSPLVFDYGVELRTHPAAVAAGVILVVTAISVTVAGLRRRRADGFLGAWFLLLLAPTSSVVPVATQVMAEHRVYLALLAPVIAIAWFLHLRLRERAGWIVAALVLAGVAATVTRNSTYASRLTLWADTAAQRPGNARAHYNLGLEQLAAGRATDAERSFRAALAIDAAHAPASHRLGTLLLETNRSAEALPHLERAARAARATPAMRVDFGRALLAAGRAEDAHPVLAAAVREDPGSAAGQLAFANASVALQRPREALPALQAVVRLAPEHAGAHYNLGHVLTQLGDYAAALAEFETAARLDPRDPAAATNAARLREFLRR